MGERYHTDRTLITIRLGQWTFFDVQLNFELIILHMVELIHAYHAYYAYTNRDHGSVNKAFSLDVSFLDTALHIIIKPHAWEAGTVIVNVNYILACQ